MQKDNIENVVNAFRTHTFIHTHIYNNVYTRQLDSIAGEGGK